MTRDLYEISRKLDLIMEQLGIDPSLIYPTGHFVIIYRGFQLFESDDYWECLDYMERCGSTLSGLSMIKNTAAADSKSVVTKRKEKQG